MASFILYILSKLKNFNNYTHIFFLHVCFLKKNLATFANFFSHSKKILKNQDFILIFFLFIVTNQKSIAIMLF
ncbi:hypothetical protein C0V77_11165 [Emticicia sp. TH156]|nr:hypothetical protein C0V77_11165 [Emticicia sp. TH156]